MKSVKLDRPDAADLLALAEDKGHMGTWSWHLATRTMHWSTGLYRLYGFDPVDGPPDLETFNSMLHPADRLDYGRIRNMGMDAALADRHFRFIRPDGGVRWIRTYGKLAHGAEGEPTHLFGIAIDDTELLQGQDAVEHQEGLFAALKTLFDLVIWRTGKDGAVADAAEWWRATGQPGHSAGWGRLSIVHPDDRAAVRQAWDEALETGVYTSSYRVELDGRWEDCVSRAVPLRNSKGEVTGWIGFAARASDIARSHLAEISEGKEVKLTPALVRGARGLLGWSANELAVHAKVSFSTVRRAETEGGRQLREQSVAAIKTALEKAGLRFVVDRQGRTGILQS